MGSKRKPSPKVDNSSAPLNDVVQSAAESVFSAEGLGILDCLAVALAIRHGQQAELTKEQKETHKTSSEAVFPEALRSKLSNGLIGSETARQEPDLEAVRHMLLQDISLGLLPDMDGTGAEALGIPSEKLAIRRALAIVTGISPKILSEAMGTAVSTLYAYADADRPNRPGPTLLFRAAYFFDLLGSELQGTAAWLREMARETAPTKRGRRKMSVEKSQLRPNKAAGKLTRKTK